MNFTLIYVRETDILIMEQLMLRQSMIGLDFPLFRQEELRAA